MDIVGYVRLSDKDEKSGSIPNQKRKIAEYAERYNLNLLQVFVDDGKSGWTFDRTGFKELEDFCRKVKSVQLLIIPHFDRFSRADPVDAMVKDRYFRDRLNIKVLQISEPPETDTSNSTYQIIRFIQAFAANEERNRIVDRTISGMRYSLMQGRFCSKPPYGYIRGYDSNNKPLMLIESEQAEVVKFIYKEFLSGKPTEQIRAEAKKHGFKHEGKSAVQRIVSNPLYAGLIHVPAYKDNPETIVKGIHSPIVSEHEYWACINMMNSKNHRTHPVDDVPLKGVLHCDCGKLFTAAPSKGKKGKYYWYYFCNTHRQGNFSAVKIHTQFINLLRALSFTTDELQELRIKLTDRVNAMLSEKGKALMNLGVRINKIDSEITKIEEKFLLSTVNPDTYNKVIAQKKLERSTLIEQRKKYEVDNQTMYDNLEKVLTVITGIADVWEVLPLENKQKFIKVVFGQNLVYTGGNYRTPYLHPFFIPKALILKEKGLLTLSTTLLNSDAFLPSAPGGT